MSSDSVDPADYAAKDIGWQALGPAIACTALATIVVIIRWYTRLRLARCPGPDDMIITLSLIVSWAMTAVIAAEVDAGIGAYASTGRESIVTKLIVVDNNLWVLTVNITKASIVAQYLRIFQDRKVKITCYVLLVLVLPASLSWGILGGTLLCSPVAKLWEPEIPGHCLNISKYWLSAAGIDIILDFCILLLPLPAISSLRLRARQKFGLMLFFLLGFSVCGFSIARLVTVHMLALQGDRVSSGIWAIIWSTIEANVGIICASILALKPLVAKLCPNLVSYQGPREHNMQINNAETDLSQERMLTPFATANMTQQSSDGVFATQSALTTGGNESWCPHPPASVEAGAASQRGGRRWLKLSRRRRHSSLSHTRVSEMLQAPMQARRKSCFQEHC